MSESTLRPQFVLLDAMLKSKDNQQLVESLSEELRMKLYGYSKQTTEGTCRMPMPPSSNIILRAKWESWTSCGDLSKEKAMETFVNLAMTVRGLKPPVAPSNGADRHSMNATAASSPTVSFANTTPTKASTSGASKRQIYTSDLALLAACTATAVVPATATTTASTATNATATTTATTSATATSASGALPTAPPSSSSIAKAPSSFPATEGKIAKEGMLFKERDHFKGWRERQFVLEDSLLHYYLDSDRSKDPRGTMDLAGCSVEATKLTAVDGIEYYPFIIKSADGTLSVHLSSATLKDTTAWVLALTKAALQPRLTTSPPALQATRRASGMFTSLPYSSTSSATATATTTTSPLSSEGVIRVTPPSNGEDDITEKDRTLSGIPDAFLQLVNDNINTVISLCSNNAAGWEVIFEKNGITASKRQYGSGLCVLGDYTFTGYSTLDIFSVIADLDRLMQFDTQRESTKKVEEFSANTWIEHIKFKQIWPLSVRDTLLLVHWRQLSDGSVVIASNSFTNKNFENAVNVPVDKGVVRADILGGYYIKRTGSESIRVKYLASLDLKGSIPTAVVNFVLKTNPMTLGRMKDFLDQSAPRAKLNSPEVTFDQLQKAVTIGKITPFEQAQGKYSQVARPVTARTSNTAFSSASNTAQAPTTADIHTIQAPPKQKSKLNTVAMAIFFFPVFLSYICPEKPRPLAFIVGLLVSFRYIYNLYLKNKYYMPASSVAAGTPPMRSNFSALAKRQIIVRFSVDLSKLLQYLDMKREESELEITLTHVTLKAVACAIKASTSRSSGQSFNGNILFGTYYQARKPGIDVGVSFDIFARGTQTVVLKVEDADLKPIQCITEEVQKRHRELRKGSDAGTGLIGYQKILSMLPPEMLYEVEKFVTYFALKFGISVPALGIDGCPHGVCTIINSPNIDGESDVDVMVVPEAIQAYGTPVTITFGGIKVLPFIDETDKDKKLQGRPVLTYTVCLDSRAGSLSEGRRLCSKMQQFLSDPYLMD